MAIIEVDGLVKRYGDRAVVNGVSFAVEQGEIFGILGPNGAGKTTTVECVEGLRTPDGGTVRVCGIDPQRDTGELRECSACNSRPASCSTSSRSARRCSCSAPSTGSRSTGGS